MPFLSVEFAVLALAAILWMRSVRGELRGIGLGLASLCFAFSFLGARGLFTTLLFCLAGYATAILARGRSFPFAIGGLTLAFVYLQGYGFLRLFLPDDLVTKTLAAAGLSFLFFKIIHVAVDHRSGAIAKLPLHRYLLYCLNFTAFLLGPIQRYQEFEEQWEGRREPLDASFEAHLDAVNRVLLGLLKKYVLAAYLASYVLLPQHGIEHLSVPEILLRTYFFYFYLYLDFSGYCDVVIGVGALMGLRPPENFHLPFFSPNVAQYWLRVHRSLTTWLTDYVFNPILMRLLRTDRFERRPLIAMSIALMATMFVSGLWHGTTINFLLFGLLHGIYLVVFRAYDTFLERRLGRKVFRELRKTMIARVLGTGLTFATTGFAYLFFVLDGHELRLLAHKVAP